VPHVTNAWLCAFEDDDYYGARRCEKCWILSLTVEEEKKKKKCNVNTKVRCLFKLERNEVFNATFMTPYVKAGKNNEGNVNYRGRVWQDYVRGSEVRNCVVKEICFKEWCEMEKTNS